MEDTWTLLSKEPKAPIGVMTDGFIMKFDRFLNWKLLSTHYDFSMDMLRIYQHRVDWGLVLKRIKFPEDFLREMTPNFNNCWSDVSKYQTLSEQFIHDFASDVDWEDILLYQSLSGKFFFEHYNYICDAGISSSDG